MSARLHFFVIAVMTSACSDRGRELRPGESVASHIPPGTSRIYRVSIPRGRLARLVCKQVETDIALRMGNNSTNMTEWGYEILYARGEGAPQELVVSAESGESQDGRFDLRYDLIPEPSARAADAIEAQNLDAEGVRLFEERRAESLGRAEKALADAASLWARAGDKVRQAQSLMMLGSVLERPRRFPEANRAYETALDLYAAAGDEAAWLAARKTWMNLGGGLGEVRGSDADLLVLETGWRRLGDRRGIHWISSNRAGRLGPAEQLSEFERLLDLARAMGASRWEVRSLEKIAGIHHREHRPRESLEATRQVRAILREMKDGPGEAAALRTVAMNLAELGENREALKVLQQARDLRRRQGDIGAYLAAIDEMARIAFVLDDGAAISKYVEEARQAVDDLEASHRLPSQHWGYVFDRAIRSGHHARSTEAREASFVLVDSHRARFTARESRQRLQAVKAILPRESLVVEYSTVDDNDSGSVWTLDTRGVEWHKLPLRTLSLANEFGRASKGEIPGDREAAREVSERLLGPIKTSIKDRRIFIVPDERMADIPFGLLPDPNFSDGSILADHHEIIYLDSAHARLAVRERPRKATPLEMALVTDPIHNRFDPRSGMRQAAPVAPDWMEVARSAGVLDERQNLPRLTGAAWEKAAITSIVKPGSLKILEGSDAGKDQVVAALHEARIVHFTVHGLIDWSAPHKSGLVLSQYGKRGAPVEGYLGFDEIAQLKTDAELVVLAACQTAVGRPISFHGVPSIATAFLRAGARRVLASLWKVNDRATAELMAAFYHGLLGPERLPPAEALRRAQFKLRNGSEWRHPKYWSGFILIGDWDPLP